MDVSENTTFDFSNVTALSSFKIAMMTISVINICASTILYGFVIWFEKFESTIEATLINQILVSLCFLNISNNFFGTLTEIVISFFGPFPEIICLSHLIWKSSMILEVFNLMIAITLTKYASIFWKINPVGSNAKFWRFFINLATFSGIYESGLSKDKNVKTCGFENRWDYSFEM
jgi:hypothetical protein